MDLAEIRKKARAEGSSSPAAKGERPGAVNARSPSVQGAPAGIGGSASRAPSPAPPPSSAVTAGVAPPAPAWHARTAEEALDALFRAHQEAGAIVEDGDLQSLQLEVEAEGDLRQLLTFSLGSEDYSLDIECIREIIKPREITDIPRVPGFILGIISLRGIIIPVFDLKRRLKLGVGEMTPASRIVVCQQEERITGLLVDGISQVIRIPGDSIEPPPAVLSGLDRDMVEGVGRYQGKMTILLRLSCIMDAELI